MEACKLGRPEVVPQRGTPPWQLHASAWSIVLSRKKQFGAWAIIYVFSVANKWPGIHFLKWPVILIFQETTHLLVCREYRSLSAILSVEFELSIITYPHFCGLCTLIRPVHTRPLQPCVCACVCDWRWLPSLQSITYQYAIQRCVVTILPWYLEIWRLTYNSTPRFHPTRCFHCCNVVTCFFWHMQM